MVENDRQYYNNVKQTWMKWRNPGIWQPATLTVCSNCGAESLRFRFQKAPNLRCRSCKTITKKTVKEEPKYTKKPFEFISDWRDPRSVCCKE